MNRVERYSPALVAYPGTVAQDVYDTYGRFTATVLTIFLSVNAQAQHLTLAHYDRFYRPDAYLETHVHHMGRWHGAAPRVPYSAAQEEPAR